jgi:hypothetical protein
MTRNGVAALAVSVVLAACSEIGLPTMPDHLSAGKPSFAISVGSSLTASTTGSSGNTSITINAPAAAAGDVLLAQVIVVEPENNTVICAPDGWIEIDQVAHSQASKIRQAIFQRTVTSAQAITPYQFHFRQSTCGNPNLHTKAASGGIVVFTGVDLANPVVGHASQNSVNSTTTATAPSVPSVPEGSMVVRFIGVALKNTTITHASVNRAFFVNSSTHKERAAAAFNATQASAGASGTFDATLGTSAEWLSHTVALRMGVSAPVAAKLAFTTLAHSGYAGDCLGPITVQTQASNSDPVNVSSNTAIGLATDGDGAFFSDSACTTTVTEVTIGSGNNSATFYYKANVVGTGSHEITASSSGLTSATQDQTINAPAEPDPTDVSDVSGSGTFGGTATLTATLKSEGSPLSGKTILFKLGGIAVCGDSPLPACPVTGGSGIAQLAGVNISGYAGGTHTDEVEAIFEGDSNYEESSAEGDLTVDPIAVTVTLTLSPTSVQYSDSVTLSAVVSPGSAPGSVQFQKIVGTDTTNIGSPVLVDEGEASLKIKVLDAPGTYTIRAAFTSSDADYDDGDDTKTLTVTKEDADVLYTGLLWASTANVNTSTASILLSATIRDITAAPSSHPKYDGSPGDIRNARVTFKIGVNPVAGCSDLTPVLVDPADLKVGTVACPWTANLGGSDSEEYQVTVEVGGSSSYYIGNDVASIVVSKPVTGMITGGGFLVNSSSAGSHAGGAGLRTNFGFNVKFNRSGRNLQGNANIIIRNGSSVYQIKANAFSSLSISTTNPGKASLESKANLTDITNPGDPVNLGGNLNLQLILTDGNPDSIGITLRTNGGQVIFSSHWNGVQTLEQILSGGNIVVH